MCVIELHNEKERQQESDCHISRLFERRTTYVHVLGGSEKENEPAGKSRKYEGSSSGGGASHEIDSPESGAALPNIHH